MATKAENERWLSDRLDELKAVQLKVATKRGAPVAAACDMSGRINFAHVRDLYVKPHHSERHVYVDGDGGGAAVIGCRDGRKLEQVAELERCAARLRGYGFKVRKVSGSSDRMSPQYRIS